MADSPSGYVAAAIFGTSVLLLFAVSASNHLIPWPRLAQEIVHRLDHAMIFIAIAGMYTPFCLVTLPLPWGIPILCVVWSFAALGASLKLLVAGLPRWLSVGAYQALGWVALVAVVPLANHLPAPGLVGLLAAGVLFSAGGIVFGARWPNPAPRLFGHHELFHTLQTAATIVIYVVVGRYAVG